MQAQQHGNLDTSLARLGSVLLIDVLKKAGVNLIAKSYDAGQYWDITLSGKVQVLQRDGSPTSGIFQGQGSTTDRAIAQLCERLQGRILVVQNSDTFKGMLLMPDSISPK